MSDQSIAQRNCANCGETKPLDAFGWKNKARGWRNRKCKDCFLAHEYAQRLTRTRGTCEGCGKPKPANHKRYCRKECFDAAQRGVPLGPRKDPHRFGFCVRCGSPRSENRTKYCSRKCMFLRPRKTYGDCPICGKAVQRRSKFCSMKCYGKFQALKWQQLTPSERETAAISRLAVLNNGANPSALERAVADALTGMGIEFDVHPQFGPYFPDIYIPSLNLVVECDGCYWHGCSECGYANELQAAHDARRDLWFRRRGFQVERIKGHAILRNVQMAVSAAVTKKPCRT